MWKRVGTTANTELVQETRWMMSNPKMASATSTQTKSHGNLLWSFRQHRISYILQNARLRGVSQHKDDTPLASSWKNPQLHEPTHCFCLKLLLGSSWAPLAKKLTQSGTRTAEQKIGGDWLKMLLTRTHTHTKHAHTKHTHTKHTHIKHTLSTHTLSTHTLYTHTH